MALCLHHIQKLKRRILHKFPSNTAKSLQQSSPVLNGSQSITVETIKQAEVQIIRAVQTSHFQEELKALSTVQILESPKDKPADPRKKYAVKSCSPLFKLDPFLDYSGILRVGGRLKQADMSDTIKFPIVLPKKGHITDLIMRHCHEQVEHQGRGMTLNEIHSRGFWVIGGSTAVARCISNCVTCCKLRGTAQQQRMADLPVDRVEPAPPFTYCAVDYFGPWIVQEGRKEIKRYGVIFTCMASRAIHLESSNTMDTHSFVNALRRFICRRDPIRQLRSDQGTNFVGAKGELKDALKELDHDTIRSELLKENCDWFVFKMNVPSASHFGGVWERQIRTIRSVMSAHVEKNGAS